MAGYSGTPLRKKLGITDRLVMYVYESPAEYFTWLSPLPSDLILKERLAGELDLIHLFVTESKVFRREFLKCKKHLRKDGMLWVSWPKKSSKVPSDLDENTIRAFGLLEGLVDVKVCAIDEVWSGLKFVYRVKDR
jgi:hypothetical protein